MDKQISRRGRALPLCVALTLWLVGCTQQEAPAPPPPAVVVVPAIQKTVPIFSDVVGRVEAKDTVELQARVEAFLLERHFTEGKPITKGQLAFTLDKREYDARLLASQAKVEKATADLQYAQDKIFVVQAEAKVSQAETLLAKAELEVQRFTTLVKSNASPQQELDNALAARDVAAADVTMAGALLENAKLNQKASIEQATAALQLAQTEVALAEVNLSYCTISTPISGLIGKAKISVGNVVGRGGPTVLATVSTIDPMRATFAIGETDLLRLTKVWRERGEKNPPPVSLVLADDSLYPHEGAVVMGERAIDRTTGALQIIAEFPNPDSLLRDGMFCRVRLALEYVENAVLIPQRAVMEQQSARAVYVVNAENKVEYRTVNLGERFESLFVVKSGVKPGERVITEGLLKVRPDMLVNPVLQPGPENAPPSATGKSGGG